MDTKRWPILAQILLGLGVVGGLINVVAGVSQKSAVVIVAGIIGLVIYWSVYKFQKWALIGLNILLSLSIIASLLQIGRMPLLILLFAIIFPSLVIFYFNSSKIKGLFKEDSAPKEADRA